MTGLLPAFGMVVFAALLPHTAEAASARDVADDSANVATTCTAGAMCGAPLAHAPQPRSMPQRDEELPWCVSANDPRCAPMHTGDTGRGPFDGDARVLSAADTDTSDTSRFAAHEPSFTPRAGLAPRHGVSHRVERPPRAIERPL